MGAMLVGLHRSIGRRNGAAFVQVGAFKSHAVCRSTVEFWWSLWGRIATPLGYGGVVRRMAMRDPYRGWQFPSAPWPDWIVAGVATSSQWW